VDDAAGLPGLGVQELVLAHSLVVPQEGETGATGAAFIAAAVLAFAAGVLEQFRISRRAA
jgi:hypothetical protein